MNLFLKIISQYIWHDERAIIAVFCSNRKWFNLIKYHWTLKFLSIKEDQKVIKKPFWRSFRTLNLTRSFVAIGNDSLLSTFTLEVQQWKFEHLNFSWYLKWYLFRKYNNDFHLSKLCLCCQILLSKSSPKQIFTKQLETNVSNLYNCFLHTQPLQVINQTTQSATLMENSFCVWKIGMEFLHQWWVSQLWKFGQDGRCGLAMMAK